MGRTWVGGGKGVWASWVEKTVTHREGECESIDRDYLKMKNLLNARLPSQVSKEPESPQGRITRRGREALKVNFREPMKRPSGDLAGDADRVGEAKGKAEGQEGRRREDGGGGRETSAGNNSDDDGKTTTTHLRFNHFSHSVLIHLFAISNRADQRRDAFQFSPIPHQYSISSDSNPRCKPCATEQGNLKERNVASDRLAAHHPRSSKVAAAVTSARVPFISYAEGCVLNLSSATEVFFRV